MPNGRDRISGQRELTVQEIWRSQEEKRQKMIDKMQKSINGAENEVLEALKGSLTQEEKQKKVDAYLSNLDERLKDADKELNPTARKFYRQKKSDIVKKYEEYLLQEALKHVEDEALDALKGPLTQEKREAIEAFRTALHIGFGYSLEDSNSLAAKAAEFYGEKIAKLNKDKKYMKILEIEKDRDFISMEHAAYDALEHRFHGKDEAAMKYGDALRDRWRNAEGRGDIAEEEILTGKIQAWEEAVHSLELHLQDYPVELRQPFGVDIPKPDEANRKQYEDISMYITTKVYQTLYRHEDNLSSIGTTKRECTQLYMKFLIKCSQLKKFIQEETRDNNQASSSTATTANRSENSINSTEFSKAAQELFTHANNLRGKFLKGEIGYKET